MSTDAFASRTRERVLPGGRLVRCTCAHCRKQRPASDKGLVCVARRRGVDEQDPACVLFEEDGTSLKASGWIRDEEPSKGGEHSRVGRERAPAIDPSSKWRWWAPWSKRAPRLEATP